MTKATKPSAKRASIAPATTEPVTLELPVNPLLLEDVTSLINQIAECRAKLSQLDQALTPIVKTAFAQAGVDLATTADLQFDSDRKAFTYIVKPK